MYFLASRHARGLLLELRQGWQQGGTDFEDPQQPQQPQQAQVEADNAGQVKRRNRQQVDDGVAAAHEAQPRESGLGEFGVSRSGPPPQQVLQREHDDRQGFKRGQLDGISGLESICGFKHHCQDVQQNQ